MPKHWSHILNVALTAALMYDIRTVRLNKVKYQQIVEMNDNLIENLDLRQNQVEFLLSIVNKDHSNLDDFDKIALQNLNFELKEH